MEHVAATFFRSDFPTYIKISNSIYDYGTFKINLIPFISTYVSGEIILSEHKDYKIIDKSELLGLDWAEADLPIVEELLKFEL